MVQEASRRIRIPLLAPDLPPLDALLPRYELIFAAKRATNFGGLVNELEAKLSNKVGAFVVTVANGTLGLELALTAAEIRPGSRVLCPALTFPASATAIARAGLTPVFVDVDPETWCIAANPVSLGGGRDFSVMAVSSFGAAWAGADVTRSREGMPRLVLDAAPAWGNQEPPYGALTCYSLHATKALIAGEGGAVATHDRKLADRLRALTNFGLGTGIVGTNGKMSEYHAAVALASLDTWPERSKDRRAAAKLYRVMLDSAVTGLQWQAWDDRWTRTIFPVLLATGTDVDAVQKWMAEEGVETRRWYYPLVCDMPQFEKCERIGKLPVSRDISARLIGLPFFTGITEAQMAKVAKSLRKALGHLRASKTFFASEPALDP